MDYRLLAASERPALEAFVAARNVPGEQLCLHLADRPEDVAADLAELEPLTARCLVARAPSKHDWQGAIIWEVGGPSGDRAWLIGPWTVTVDLEAHMGLIRAALDRLPAEVTRVDNFVDLGFDVGLAAHRALGFDPRRTVHIMRADRHLPVPSSVPIVMADGLSPSDRARLEALHDDAFPDTHTDVAGMLAATDGRLWYAIDDGLVGYVHVTRSSSMPESRVEYVAVHPTARGRGIGRALLSTAVGWLLGEGAPVVYLTVDAENDRALGVYRAAGFVTHRSGLALTLRRPGSDS